MQRLIHIMKDGFKILAGNLVLIYPVLFFTMLLSIALPQRNTVPLLDSRWILLTLVLGLLTFAFSAGWLNMIYTASDRWLHPVKDKKPALQGLEKQNSQQDSEKIELPESFILLGKFFPGVGNFFGAFTVGGLIHLAFIIALSFAMSYFVQELGGIPNIFNQLAALSAQSQAPQPADVEALINGLSPADRKHLEDFSMLILSTFLCWGVFFILTMFWPSLVIAKGISPVKAYLLSIRQFFKTPLQILAIGGWFFITYLLLTFSPLAGSAIWATLFQFAGFFMMIYCLLVLFLYTQEAYPDLPARVDAPATESTSDTAS